MQNNDHNENIATKSLKIKKSMIYSQLKCKKISKNTSNNEYKG